MLFRSRGLGLEQVELALGDFHRLPYADARFDLVFCIEALCHATDLPRALGEAQRVGRCRWRNCTPPFTRSDFLHFAKSRTP